MRDRLAALRRRRPAAAAERGFRGGRILPHRAMLRLDVSRWLLVDLIALPIIFLLAFFIALDRLLDSWQALFELLRVPLGLPGQVAVRVVEIWPLYFAVPHFTAIGRWPNHTDLMIGWWLTGGAILLGWLMRGDWAPAGYFLRAIAFIQLTAQLWFTFSTADFSYSLATHMSGLLANCLVILFIAPIAIGGVYFIFDMPLWQKLLLGTLMALHLMVFIPMLVVVHAWIIYRCSLLTLPLLSLIFGPLLLIFVFVALYGWAMSWRDEGAR